MLVAVNLTARMILFAVELFLFALGQMTVVSSHISFFLVLNVLLLALDVGSLPGSHGAIFNAIGDAVLLILFTRIDFVNPRMSRVVLPGPRLGNGRADRKQPAHRHDYKRLCDLVH